MRKPVQRMLHWLYFPNRVSNIFATFQKSIYNLYETLFDCFNRPCAIETYHSGLILQPSSQNGYAYYCRTIRQIKETLKKFFIKIRTSTHSVYEILTLISIYEFKIPKNLIFV